MTEGLEEIAHGIAEGRMMLVSDGAVRKRRGAYGWKLVPTDASDHNGRVEGYGPCHADPRVIDSFRTEASGIFSGILFVRALLTYFDIQPCQNATLETYCDNIAVIHRMTDSIPRRGPRHRLIPEYDLINAIQQLSDSLPISVRPKHVKGHQDDGTKYEDLPYAAQINVDCDEIAGRTLDTPPTDMPQRDTASFLLSSDAALSIRGTLITKDIPKQIRMASNGRKLRHHIMKKTGWSQLVFDLVDWDALESALSKEPLSQRVRLIKFMHEWLPTMKRQHRYKMSATALCPVCKKRIETQTHFFRCKHPDSLANFKLQLQRAKKFLEPYRPLPLLWKTITSHLLYQFSSGPPPTDRYPDDSIGRKLRTAVNHQIHIGWKNMLRGRISPLWGEIQNDFYCQIYANDNDKRPKHLSAPVFQIRLIRAMWQIFLGVWEQRCDILHDKEVGAAKLQMDAEIQHIHKYAYHYVCPSDMDLIDDYPLTTALELPPATKSRYLRTLQIAVLCRHKTLDCLQSTPSHTIDTYFEPMHTT